MVTRIVYDTEFVDDGLSIAPISIAMRRARDSEACYAIVDSLETIARAAENPWMVEHVLKWLPVDVAWSDLGGALGAKVAWNEDHPDYRYVMPLNDVAEMVEDFVLRYPDPQLWGYYADYDHVLYAQLFGPMAELPDGMPMYTLDVQQEAVMRGLDAKLPLLPAEIVDRDYDGTRREHDARYDAHEEEFRLEWLLRQRRV
jgi:hypothetical protein